MYVFTLPATNVASPATTNSVTYLGSAMIGCCSTCGYCTNVLVVFDVCRNMIGWQILRILCVTVYDVKWL